MLPEQITDHALVRWLERVIDMDVEKHRRFAAQATADLVASGASGGWVMGTWCVVKNGRVITFLPERPSGNKRIQHGNLDDTRPLG